MMPRNSFLRNGVCSSLLSALKCLGEAKLADIVPMHVAHKVFFGAVVAVSPLDAF